VAGKAQHVFETAVELAGPEREAFLRGACGEDQLLRDEVDSLLRAFELGAGFLANPTAAPPPSQSEAATVATPLREVPGTRIGPYRLLQLIGEGGFGSVFMAEQERPVSRKVALKIIKLGMDTRAVIARFEAERQALALMDHPNIARVLDAGATETGRPYFVMELCKGDPIVEYCDKNNLSIADRLELFAQVCQAVQHAHTKGIIHRDIKPSNILVSTQDGRPHAKVIDFGIAKATASKLTEKTLFTEHRQLIGTPEYMSPEQAEGSLDIDTRTDVYSLGVLLYELLTGTTPFSSNELRSAAYAEIQRIIREVEPPKPSTRLSHNANTLASVAAKRHVEPKKLGTIIRGDLDWIVMKALEKDRGRRYETANGLAMDIHRYLSGEAVLAAPPSTSYRMRKFVRRHRAQVAAAALVTAALLLGLAGTAWQAKVASNRALAARKAEAAAKKARDDEKTRADELKQVSDFQDMMLRQVNPTAAGVRLTEDVNSRFAAALEKAKVSESERPGLVDEFRHEWAQVNATDAAKALIDDTILKPAVKAIDEQFKDQPIVDAQLRQALGDRYHGLGLYDAAFGLMDSALKTRRHLLGDDHPATLQSIISMGSMLRDWGKLDDAEPYCREALERSRRVLGENDAGTIVSISNMGGLLRAQSKYSEAEQYSREALEKSRRVLGEKHETTLIVLSNLGSALQAQGKYPEAENVFREAMEKRRDAASVNNVGIVLQQQGKLDEAERYYREGLEIARRDEGEESQHTLACLNNLGALLEFQNRNAEAEGYFREALEKRRRILAEGHPEVDQSIHSMGRILEKLGRPAAAEPLYRELLARRRRFLGDENPDTLNAIHFLSGVLTDQQKYDEAEPLYRELVEKSPRVFGENAFQTLLSLNLLGTTLAPLGKLDEAERVLAKGVAACRRAHPEPHSTTALLLHHHAYALLMLNRPDDAEGEAREALGMYRDHPDWDSGQGETLHAASILASIFDAQGKPDEVLSIQREALAIQRRTFPPGSAAFSNQLAAFGLDLLRRGTLETVREAEPLLRECLEIRARAIPGSWLVANSKSMLGAAIVAVTELDPALTGGTRAERLREAETLLLDGHADLTDNAAVPSPAVAGGDRRREALERIVHLYDVWDKAEPGKGYDAKAAQWRNERDRPTAPAMVQEKKP
jgi:serine/threonine protein kinase